MNCPYCQSPVDETTGACTKCGAQVLKKPALSTDSAGTETRATQAEAIQTAKAVSNTGVMLGRAARQARIARAVDEGELISDRAYNGIIIGVLLWGLVVNYILCSLFSESILTVKPAVLMIGYLVLAISGTIIAMKSTNPFVSFLGYNMVVVPFGLVIAWFVGALGGMGSQVVTYAFLYTMLISVGMFACYLIAPQFFSKLGGVLLAVLGGLVLCELVLLIFHVDQVVTDWIAAAVFSLYIGYDIYRSQQYPKTVDNAVDSAVDIYMDIANLFIRLLIILARSRSDD